MFKVKYAIRLVLVASIFLASCGGGGGDGTPPPPPPPPANTTSFDVTLGIQQIVAGLSASPAAGSATANLTLNEDDNTFTGTITLNGIVADSISINTGFAGEVGDEVVALGSDSSTSWSIPSNTVLSNDQRNNLEGGQLYVLLTTTGSPSGALRGQILPDGFSLTMAQLSQQQAIPPTGSNASGTGFLTLNEANGDIAVRVITNNFVDPTIAHIHQALAGLSGDVLVTLSQDVSDPSLWSNEGNEETLDASGLSAFNTAQLYFNFHSTAFGAGEIRGQIVPDGFDITFTELTGDDVVIAGATGVMTDASAVAASTLDINAMQLTTHLNTVNLEDASGVTLNQAPAGQNGPSIVDFVQDGPSSSLWSAINVAATGPQFAALNNQGLYFTVATQSVPEGEVRGQYAPNNSLPGNTDTFQITNVNPSNASELDALPSNATLTFNRDVLSSSLSANSILLAASGGDGSFGEANDVNVSGISSSVSTNTVVVDFNGIVVADDIFQLSIANNQLTDADGVILDGDGDGNIGGDFSSTFSVVTPPTPQNPNANFSAIQTNVFMPICAVCHGGASPAASMSLAAGQAYNNIVSVQSGQSSLLRIDPNNPDDSYLIRKLEGGPGIVGGRMPLGQTALSQSTIDDIRQWVSEGAQNN